jgi:hypothetical protein
MNRRPGWRRTSARPSASRPANSASSVIGLCSLGRPSSVARSESIRACCPSAGPRWRAPSSPCSPIAGGVGDTGWCPRRTAMWRSKEGANCGFSKDMGALRPRLHRFVGTTGFGSLSQAGTFLWTSSDVSELAAIATDEAGTAMNATAWLGSRWREGRPGRLVGRGRPRGRCDQSRRLAAEGAVVRGQLLGITRRRDARWGAAGARGRVGWRR